MGKNPFWSFVDSALTEPESSGLQNFFNTCKKEACRFSRGTGEKKYIPKPETGSVPDWSPEDKDCVILVPPVPFEERKKFLTAYAEGFQSLEDKNIMQKIAEEYTEGDSFPTMENVWKQSGNLAWVYMQDRTDFLSENYKLRYEPLGLNPQVKIL